MRRHPTLGTLPPGTTERPLPTVGRATQVLSRGLAVDTLAMVGSRALETAMAVRRRLVSATWVSIRWTLATLPAGKGSS